MQSVPTELRQRLSRYGQEHVLAWWDHLDDAQRWELVRQLEGIDFDELSRLHAQRLHKAVKIDPARIAPLPEATRDDASHSDHHGRGEEAYRGAELAFLVVAGGQGTRLGFDRAKGIYPIGPITGK